MRISIMSFGFNNGVPEEASILYDARILPNPYHVPELNPHGGLDARVVSYVLDNDLAKGFFPKLLSLIEYSLAKYRADGIMHCTLGVGCAGGRHRSVAVAERIGALLRENGYEVMVTHRDLAKSR